MSEWQRWRGLSALVRDAVEHASQAIEKVQKETAQRPFGVLEQIPGIAEPARGIHAIHDVTVTAVHGSIRLVNRTLGNAMGAVLESIEHNAQGKK